MRARSRSALIGPLVAASLLLAACTDADDGEATVRNVAACEDLRRRENELIAAANQALAELGDADDDASRTAAIVGGFDRLLAIAEEQVATIDAVEPELADALEAGARRAVAELADERRAFVDEVETVTAADERGRAGQLQNALEKAFSVMEPPRRVYEDAGLAGATDGDPDCRFVTQRGDPAVG